MNTQTGYKKLPVNNLILYIIIQSLVAFPFILMIVDEPLGYMRLIPIVVWIPLSSIVLKVVIGRIGENNLKSAFLFGFVIGFIFWLAFGLSETGVFKREHILPIVGVCSLVGIIAGILASALSLIIKLFRR